MIYDNDSIILLFESGEFKFDNSDKDYKKIEELENKIKDEVDFLSKLTKKFNKETGLNSKKSILSKIGKSLNVVATALGIFAIKNIGIIPAILAHKQSGIIKIIISVVAGICEFFIGLKVSSISDGLNNSLIELYEKDINIALNLCNKLDSMDMDEDLKSKVRDSIGRLKDTINEIDEFKKSLKEDDKNSEKIGKKYNLEKLYDKFNNGYNCSVCVVTRVFAQYNGEKFENYLEIIAYSDDNDDISEDCHWIDTNENELNIDIYGILEFGDNKWYQNVKIDGYKHLVIKLNKNSELPKVNNVYIIKKYD